VRKVSVTLFFVGLQNAFSLLLSREKGQVWVGYSVKIVDPAIMCDFAIDL
jgi:hypothetical protein